MLGAVLALALAQFAQPQGPIVSNPALMSSVVFSLLPSVPASAECAGTAITGTHGEAITVARSSSGYCTKSDGTMVSVAANLPRVESAGLLVEAAATNLLLRSDALDNASWTKDGTAGLPTVTADFTTAPDGTTTAEKIVYPAVAAGQYSRVWQQFTATAAAHTYAIWLRADAPTPVVIFFLVAGTTYSTTANLTMSWQRFVVANKTLTAASWFVMIGFDGVSTAEVITASALPQAGKTIYAWGAQVEQSAFATSYIATAGTQVARTDETATFANPLVVGPYCVAATAKPLGNAWGGRVNGIIGSTSFGAANTFGLYGSNTTGQFRIDVTDNASGSKSVIATAGLSSGSRALRACSDNAGALTVYVDGVAVASGPSGAGTGILSAQAATLRLGWVSGASNILHGWIKNVCLSRTSTGCAQ